MAARRPAAPALLRAARGGRDDHLPHRGARATSCRASTSRSTSRARSGRRRSGYRRSRATPARWRPAPARPRSWGCWPAWSILNKVNDRGDAPLLRRGAVVCPNVTIRSRLGELDPGVGDASLYRDPGSGAAAPDAGSHAGARARHQLARVRAARACRAGGVRRGQGREGRRRGADRRDDHHRPKTTTARGTALSDAGGVSSGRSRRACSAVLEEDRDKDGNLKFAGWIRRAVRRERHRPREPDSRPRGRRQAEHPRLERRGPSRLPHPPGGAGSRRVRSWRGGRSGRVLQGGDGLGRGSRPHPQAARHQLLRGSVGHAVLPRPHRPGHQPSVPLGGERSSASPTPSSPAW